MYTVTIETRKYRFDLPIGSIFTWGGGVTHYLWDGERGLQIGGKHTVSIAELRDYAERADFKVSRQFQVRY